MIAGHWKHHEIWDGTYTLDDLLDIVEVMDVYIENELRAQVAAEWEAKLKNGQQ